MRLLVPLLDPAGEPLVDVLFDDSVLNSTKPIAQSSQVLDGENDGQEQDRAAHVGHEQELLEESSPHEEVDDSPGGGAREAPSLSGLLVRQLSHHVSPTVSKSRLGVAGFPGDGDEDRGGTRTRPQVVLLRDHPSKAGTLVFGDGQGYEEKYVKLSAKGAFGVGDEHEEEDIIKQSAGGLCLHVPALFSLPQNGDAENQHIEDNTEEVHPDEIRFNLDDLVQGIVQSGLKARFPDFPEGTKFAKECVRLVSDQGCLLDSTETAFDDLPAAIGGSSASGYGHYKSNKSAGKASSPRAENRASSSSSNFDSAYFNCALPLDRDGTCDFISVLVKWEKSLHFPSMVRDLHNALVTGTYTQPPEEQTGDMFTRNRQRTNDLTMMMNLNAPAAAGAVGGGHVLGGGGGPQGGPEGHGLLGGPPQFRRAAAPPPPGAIQRQTYLLPSLEDWQIGLFQSAAEDVGRFGKTPGDNIYGFSQLLQIIDRVKSANFVYPPNINLVFHQQELQALGGLGAFLSEVAARVVQSQKLQTNEVREIWTFREGKVAASNIGSLEELQASTSSSFLDREHADQAIVWKTNRRVRKTTPVHEILRQLRVFQVFELRHGLKAAVDGDKLSICERLLKYLALRGDLVLAVREQTWPNQMLTNELLARRARGTCTTNSSSDFNSMSDFNARKVLMSEQGTAKATSSRGGGSTPALNRVGSRESGAFSAGNLMNQNLVSNDSTSSATGLPLPSPERPFLERNRSDTSTGRAPSVDAVRADETSSIATLNAMGAGSGGSTFLGMLRAAVSTAGSTSSTSPSPNNSPQLRQKSSPAQKRTAGETAKQQRANEIEVGLSDGSTVEEELWCVYKHLMGNKLEYSWISLRWTCLKLLLTLGVDEDGSSSVGESKTASSSKSKTAVNIEGNLSADSTPAMHKVVSSEDMIKNKKQGQDDYKRNINFAQQEPRFQHQEELHHHRELLYRKIRSLIVKRFQDLLRFARWNERKLRDYDPFNPKQASAIFPDDFDEFQFLYASEMHRKHMDDFKFAPPARNSSSSIMSSSPPSSSIEANMNNWSAPAVVSAGGTRSILPPPTIMEVASSREWSRAESECSPREFDAFDQGEDEGGQGGQASSKVEFQIREQKQEALSSSLTPSSTSSSEEDVPSFETGMLAPISRRYLNRKRKNKSSDSATARASSSARNSTKEKEDHINVDNRDAGGTITRAISSPSSRNRTASPDEWAGVDGDKISHTNSSSSSTSYLLEAKREEASALITQLHSTLRADIVGIAAELLQPRCDQHHVVIHHLDQQGQQGQPTYCSGASNDPFNANKEMKSSTSSSLEMAKKLFIQDIQPMKHDEHTSLAALKLYLNSFASSLNP
ncbi:unnamed protein product [Amoebophrya sp. A25]|nr:unnamed protein product [Amoebophrya sp. A25]|eukprot:GSA25T00009268001.1